MRYLSHIIETKGVLHSLERSLQIIRRYSFGRKRFAEMVSSIAGSLYIEGYRDFNEADKLNLLARVDESGYPLLRLWRWPQGARCALTVSSDVDSIIFADFLKRFIYF